MRGLSTASPPEETVANAADFLATHKYNKPFPVVLIPSALTFYLTEKQAQRQRDLLDGMQALGDHDQAKLKDLQSHPH